MGDVASVFVSGADNHSDAELSLFSDILTRLLDEVELSGRVELSETVARLENTPRDVALRLANDEAEVAAPVLQHSPVLSDDDLLHLAKKKGQEHLLALSKREKLETRVTDVLLERGEQPVHRSIAANPGAKLSDWGGEFLVKLAESDASIRDSMVGRDDLGRENFEKLLALLPPDRRAKLKHVFEANEDLACDLIDAAEEIMEKDTIERRKKRMNNKVVLQEIRGGTRDLDTTVTEYCHEEAFLDLAFVLAKLANIDDKYVKNIMLMLESDGLALLCRSLEIGDAGYRALCEARCKRLNLSSSLVAKWAADYKKIKVADAQRVLRFVKVRVKVTDGTAL